MKYLILAFCLAATPAISGGPVIVEEPEVTEPDRKIGGIVVGLIVLGALIALAGGSDNCNGEPVVPPVNGGC